MSRNQPDPIPALLLARLAVDIKHQCRELAEALLKHFLVKALEVAELVGVRVILVHAANAALYEPAGLAVALAAVAPRGVLAVWSSHRAPRLLAALHEVAGTGDEVVETVLPVVRGARTFEYALYSVVRAPA